MSYSTVNPTIGADPEFFIFQELENKELKLIPADKVLPGKDEKLSVFGGTAFFDGVQAEINPRYNTCRELFIANIRDSLNGILQYIDKKDIKFIPYPSLEVNLDDIKDSDNECFRFGCAPDNCIYDEERNIKYPDGKKFSTRFAGGHIHLGFSSTQQMRFFKDPDNLEKLIMMMDLIPGIISVAIANNEREIFRRKWYGQAGTYRIQPHGMEYRTLSPFWLTSPELTSLMTGLVRDAFKITYGKDADELLEKVDIKKVRKIIDEFNVEEAKRIWKDVIKPYYENMPKTTTRCPLGYKHQRNFLELMMKNGYEHYFNPTKMLYYWGRIKVPGFYKNDFSMTFGYKTFCSNFGNKKEYRDKVIEFAKE